ncbi:hypothetical protein AB0K60_29930 [Thermopolyspora sp. NPDC052614]|uniref:hypothetical protein n=1 Tax=Thermopolyspora sp. NPDC052614 TaxID=3155682 RepID=UPI00341E1946
MLVLMGSGETSPTMVTVHRRLAARLTPPPRGLLLDTPYAFQENAADVSARALRYFARSVGLDVQVLPENDIHRLRTAEWVFCGPGSPTYALDRWAATRVGEELRARVLARTGVTVLASAAACTAGRWAVPVYEIYKVGATPHWRDGLDLLAAIGIQAAVIPHYDNAEGGTHDTRYCYLGERRLAMLERELPPTAAVLGVDEHTAVLIDLKDGGVEVHGRGALTVRRRDAQTTLPTGTTLTLPDLRALVEGAGRAPTPPPTPTPAPAAEPAQPVITLAEAIRACESRFDTAVAAADAAAMTEAVLDLEAETVKWAGDTEEDEGGVEQARAVLRHLIARLGRASDARTTRERLDLLVESTLALRADLRERGQYGHADALRAVLARAGVEVRDGTDGPHWTLVDVQAGPAGGPDDRAGP